MLLFPNLNIVRISLRSNPLLSLKSPDSIFAVMESIEKRRSSTARFKALISKCPKSIPRAITGILKLSKRISLLTRFIAFALTFQFSDTASTSCMASLAATLANSFLPSVNEIFEFFKSRIFKSMVCFFISRLFTSVKSSARLISAAIAEISFRYLTIILSRSTVPSFRSILKGWVDSIESAAAGSEVATGFD